MPISGSLQAAKSTARKKRKGEDRGFSLQDYGRFIGMNPRWESWFARVYWVLG